MAKLFGELAAFGVIVTNFDNIIIMNFNEVKLALFAWSPQDVTMPK